MSVKIRLKRMGSKKRPFYRIVATDSRSPRDGRFIETLGYYNPITEPADIHVKEALVFKWMRCGAIPTATAASLLRRNGTMKRWALLKQGVAESDLDAKYEELKSRETPPMSAEERSRIAAEKKAAAEAVKAKAEAEASDAKPAAEAAEGEGSDEDTK
ncbi:MAG: 30S ribosomal protein S16 [Candidatus Krumholzibacteriota bacterium]|nr:30S ribosomal protein S16 [Candidatus Krumholzibacteriota bacterium]